jgi:hypothetical protein
MVPNPTQFESRRARLFVTHYADIQRDIYAFTIAKLSIVPRDLRGNPGALGKIEE